MSNEKAKAYWGKNEQSLKDIGRFEGPKGVVYQVFRDLDLMAPVGRVVTNEAGLKAISFETASWEALKNGDIIVGPGVPSEPVNFDLTYPLPRWSLEPAYAHEVTVEFDGAEGGAVWINDSESDEAIAIRGPEAMRELARLLNAFADGYTGPLEGEQ